MPLALAGLLFGSVQAAFQDDVRKLFAFSSVAQAGYMLAGLAIAGSLGLTAGLLHLINHAMMKAALFMALGAVALRLGATRIEQFAGLGRVMPFTMASVAVGGLSLIGAPLTAGFVSKWYLLQAAFERGWWWAAAAMAIASLLALYYVARILEAAYLRPPPEREGRVVAVKPPPIGMAVSLWLLVIANIGFGVNAGFTTQAACRAADAALAAGGACAAMGAP
jgi:multicomponent Na+:H+ antiporter subunit D